MQKPYPLEMSGSLYFSDRLHESIAYNDADVSTGIAKTVRKDITVGHMTLS